MLTGLIATVSSYAGVREHWNSPGGSRWRAEYGGFMLACRIVDDIDSALSHIDEYGSRHTEAIVTEDESAAGRFLAATDAANVFHNASTRFADRYRYGLGAEVGISTEKLHARGPVGLSGLTTTKWLLCGDGQVVASYVGPGARAFRHEPRRLESGRGRWLRGSG